MEENTKLPEAVLPEGPVTVCDVRFRNGSKTYYFDPNGVEPKPDDHVIIETARGYEFGYCCGGPHTVKSSDIVAPLRKVIRIANERDEYVNNDNRRLEKSAYATCQEKIEQLGLDMQLVSCECAFDGSKILFYFTADGRVDFRELVKQLASTFRTRVELRQIGVRDKAKMVGGLGICGRPFCCGQFLSDFAPVSIKMAKTQNLSLNPTKISGTCGRLMCCLKYEQEAYEDLHKTSPKVESFVDTPDGRGTVVDVNLMHQSVKVRMEKNPEELKTFRSSEIAVLRSGKAKKTDPPIPEDLAPISGSKSAPAPVKEFPRFERSAPRTRADAPQSHRVRREKKPAQTEPTSPAPSENLPKKAKKAANEQARPLDPPAEAKQHKNDRKRGGKNTHKSAAKRPPAEASKTGTAAEQPAKAAPTTEAAAELAPAAKKKSKRRYYHHRPKKQS